MSALRATVLIPTHAHPQSLAVAVASVQAQTVQDFELLIVGDGVGDDTRAIAADLAASDRRIRFLDFPKGPRKGEVHRHAALAEARGRIVAYLGDDDIWLPDHLETLAALLEKVDFGHTLHVGMDDAGQRFVLPGDLGDAAFRARMCDDLFNVFDLTFGGHRLDAYRRLPHGWRTTPDDFPWTDLYFWRQFLTQPWCRAATAMVPTGICTQTHRRPGMSDADRAAELRALLADAATPGFRESLWRLVTAQLAPAAARDIRAPVLALEQQVAALREASRADAAALAALRDDLAARHDEIRAQEAAIAATQAELARATRHGGLLAAEIAALRASHSWRVTAPLRAAASALRAARR